MEKGYIARLQSSEALKNYASRLSSLQLPALFEERWARRSMVAAIVLLSLYFIAYGFWLLQLERGARAVAHGDLPRAASIYSAAEWPFPSVLARVFPDGYSRAAFPKIGALYNSGKTGDAAQELERAVSRAPSLSERAEYAFWNGNILLRRALEATDTEIILKHLYAASTHFRKAIEATPDDWDIKYNYELVQQLLYEQESEKAKEDSKMKSILERVRTITEPAPKEPPPPDKQG